MKSWSLKRIKTGEEYYNFTQTIFFVQVILPLTVFAIGYLEAQQNGFQADLTDSTLTLWLWASPLISLLIILVGFFLFYKQRSQARKLISLRAKLEALFMANLIKYSVLSVASIIITLGMFITQQEVMGAWTGIILFIWSLSLPTRQRFGRDLKLDRAEREVMVFKGQIDGK